MNKHRKLLCLLAKWSLNSHSYLSNRLRNGFNSVALYVWFWFINNFTFYRLIHFKNGFRYDVDVPIVQLYLIPNITYIYTFYPYKTYILPLLASIQRLSRRQHTHNTIMTLTGILYLMLCQLTNSMLVLWLTHIHFYCI